MASVPVKSAERQAELIILRHREMLLGQRTQAINALRGHATEFGVIGGKGTAHVQPLLDRLAEDTTIPAIARAMFARMGAQIAGLDRQIADLDAELLAQHKAHPVSRLLAEVPGIGPVTAITLALGIDIQAFASGRHFAA
jgi:transposase